MYPGAAVSGWYFSHPESRYINIGRVDKDQLADYARRKQMPLSEMERWLAPNLGYEPDVAGAGAERQGASTQQPAAGKALADA
jgi:hypothetical protein